MFNSILAPTDGSEHAGRAIEAAVDLALKYDARLIILHGESSHGTAQESTHILRDSTIPPEIRREIDRLQEISAPIPVGGARGRRTLSPQLEQYVGEFIVKRAEDYAKAAGVGKVATHITHGSPNKRIIEAAKEEKADLLVMGTRGLGGIHGYLQGSVSQSVRSHCHCACLTIP